MKMTINLIILISSLITATGTTSAPRLWALGAAGYLGLLVGDSHRGIAEHITYTALGQDTVKKTIAGAFSIHAINHLLVYGFDYLICSKIIHEPFIRVYKGCRIFGRPLISLCQYLLDHKKAPAHHQKTPHRLKTIFLSTVSSITIPDYLAMAHYLFPKQ